MRDRMAQQNGSAAWLHAGQAEPALEEIRDLCMESPNGWAPSPGFDTGTMEFVGGEVRRRMFPQYHTWDRPS